METRNVTEMACPVPVVLRYAKDVGRWPDWLPHYRWVKVGENAGTQPGTVEMAALRRFPGLTWPVWWESEMQVDEAAGVVYYRHIRGITRGMDVEWRLRATERGTEVTILHRWERPGVGRWIANRIIGPLFVHAIAEQTLAGIKRQAEEAEQ
ncbi:hypothetical protein J31TS4_16740 [Paenibacillus sp. J31TS4]|uniref:SRPBCC family protein n=1 Tax=Paenibacillus sp. J31TS4 TaxID=2807195 RepID=UPI001B0A9CD9|nr:SRPBCC family protein [Paenibacillus sp. J31TS4]GIP38394.1 hypothetical protein J31TS4_16740 [Paenibacillus sp. J31TS4]